MSASWEEDGFTTVQPRRAKPAAGVGASAAGATTVFTHPSQPINSPYKTANLAFAPLARAAGRAGASGYDQAAITAFRKQCLAALLPHLVKVDQPVTLRSFNASVGAVLVPLLRRSAPTLQEGPFKTLWGQVNTFAIPALAAMKGISGWQYDPVAKSTNLYISAPGAPPPVSAADAAADMQAARMPALGLGSAGAGAGAGAPANGGAQPATAAAAASLPAAAADGWLGSGSAAGRVSGSASSSGATHWCVFCGSAVHLMSGCSQFHALLESIFAAGVVAGRAERDQQGQAQGQQAGAAGTYAAGTSFPANDWNSLMLRAQASMQQALQPQPQQQHSASSSSAAWTSAAAPAASAADPAGGEEPALCMLCGLRAPTSMLIPCGHASCQPCAEGLAGAGADEGGTPGSGLATCPVCSTEVECIL